MHTVGEVKVKERALLLNRSQSRIYGSDRSQSSYYESLANHVTEVGLVERDNAHTGW